MQANTNTQGWHTAQWGIWGWAETILKLVAIGAGLLAVFRVTGEITLDNHPHILALILMVVLSLGAVFQVFIRWGQKESISFAFAVLNLLGHFGLLYALLHVPGPRTTPIIFGAFYALGQGVKIQFLRATGYTEGGANTRSMVTVAAVMAVLYALVAVLVLV
jgi:hypothetical protein